MPIVRTFADAREKYVTKYDGANVTARLTAVGEIKNRRYQAGSSTIYNIVETVRGILESSGVPALAHGMYYAFAQKITKLTFSHSGATLSQMVSGLKAQWVTAYKADPAILDKIILAVLGTVPPY